MKGAPGIILAVFLGLVGAVLNWVYLENKTKGAAVVAFLGIKDGVQIRPGQQLKSSNFVKVEIPDRQAQTLKSFVYLYEDRATLEDTPATQNYAGGELVMRDDYRTPPAELNLDATEEMFFVAVDSRELVPSLLNPGDLIDFEIPALTQQATRLPSEPPPVGADAAAAVTESERIGPFRIKSLGDRLGSLDVMKATRRAPVQERQIGIVIDTTKPEEVERAARLRARLDRGDYRNINVILLGKK